MATKTLTIHVAIDKDGNHEVGCSEPTALSRYRGAYPNQTTVTPVRVLALTVRNAPLPTAMKVTIAMPAQSKDGAVEVTVREIDIEERATNERSGSG